MFRPRHHDEQRTRVDRVCGGADSVHGELTILER
jgi:hypothetical protein